MTKNDIDEKQHQQHRQQTKKKEGDLDYDYATRGQVNGAALIGGIAGFFLGGPLLGALGAGVSACLAATDGGKAGDFVRRGGTVVADAGKKVQKEEEEHHVLDKTAEKLHLEEGVQWIEKKWSSYSPKWGEWDAEMKESEKKNTKQQKG